MTERESSSCERELGHCITCGDEGIPMRVTGFAAGAAVCADPAGRAHEVAVDLIDNVAVGTTVLVHAGVAIGVSR